jgi:branched-chain amino acid transport system permease protein
MTLALNAVLTGLAVGAVYGLVAVGYTIVFNTTRVFNLAHGDFVMIAVMVSYVSLNLWHLPSAVAFLLVLISVTFISVVEERVAVRPFLSGGSFGLGWFISTLAFSLVIEATVVILYGDNPVVTIPSFLPSVAVAIGPVRLSSQLVFAFVALVIVMGALDQFYRRTWLGQAMRATAEDREAASLRGIDPDRMSLLAFVMAGVAAAVAGFVLAPIVGSDNTIGLTYSVKGFLALAIGGFGSFRGAIVAAMLLGVSEQIFDLYASAQFETVADLALLMIVLTVRPGGLFGAFRTRQV